MSKKILFFGNERLATGVTTTAPTLRALVKAGYEVCAVVVAQNDSKPSRKKRGAEIIDVAAEHDIPVLSPEDLGQAKDELRAFGAEAAVLISYGKIVPQSIIDIFPKGIINVHPSLLPLHRGSTPIESAILNGDKETGVSLMRLTEQVDAGPVYAQSKLTLYKLTKQMVADTLTAWGIELLLRYLPDILDGSSVPPAPQYETLATHDKLIKKEDGIIDWYKDADQIEQEIRAYAGWPRSRATIGGKEVIITKAKVSDKIGAPGDTKTDDGKLIAFCKWGALEIESLIPAGKKEMTAKAFLAGYKL
jgi:methionyl-tRNA formyltransferase